jgi:type II secretory pathway predicted ATPase ExeA
VVPEDGAGHDPYDAIRPPDGGCRRSITLGDFASRIKSADDPEKDGDLTGKPEKSERALLKVMQRCQKPIVFFIDDGHDLHGQTLRSLKQFIEKTSHRGSRLTVVLEGV